jgi:hypothetical protein
MNNLKSRINNIAGRKTIDCGDLLEAAGYFAVGVRGAAEWRDVERILDFGSTGGRSG